jgi:hypothetical protein
MTVSFHAIGAKTGAGPTSSVAIALPTPTAKGVMVLCGRAVWMLATAKDEPGWVRTADLLGGTFTLNPDDHFTTIRVDRRELTGTELGNVTFEQVTSNPGDGVIGIMVAYARTGRAWDVASGTGTDNVHDANRSATCSTALSLAPGDVVVAFAATDTDNGLASFSGQAITAPGITFGATTRRTSGIGSSTGNDGNIELFEATVTAGTATAAPTLAFTTTTLQCGPVAFVRLRDVAPVVSGWRPSTSDLLDLRGVPRRFDDFRFELVDRRNRRLGDVNPDLGKNPTVTWDTSRDVHRSLDNFYLPANEQVGINKFTDRVRVWMTLQNGDEFSLGVFLWADANEPRRSWGYETQGKLLDKTYVLDQPLITPQSLPRYLTPLEWLVGHITQIPEFNADYKIAPDFRLDFESGRAVWLLVSLGEEAASKELGSPVNWQGGTTHLRMANDIMSLVQYMPVHCDRNGTLILRKAVPIDLLDPQLSYDIGERIVENSMVRSVDGLAAPNYVVVVDTAANQTPIRGVWRAPAAAPHSEANRDGVAIGRYITVSGLSTQQEADLEAERQGQYLLQAGSWKEWSSPADPRHDGYDILSVEGDKMLETRWQITCVAGQPMTHRALRVYPKDSAVA